MIEKASLADLDPMLAIWLEASCIAHDFIPSSFWEDKMNDMRTLYLPSAENRVYKDDTTGEVVGFISIAGDYIPALFVTPKRQKKGVGQALLDCVKESRDTLSLHVYAENKGSVLFYRKQGFVIAEESIEEHTGHKEYMMVYTKK